MSAQSLIAVRNLLAVRVSAFGWMICLGICIGQGVQLPPTTTDTFGTAPAFSTPPTFASPPIGGVAPSTTAPGFTPGVPPVAPPTATLGPPTSFDPYANPSVQGGLAPPAQLPYNYAQPATPAWPGSGPVNQPPTGWQPYTQQGAPPTGGIYPDGLPYEWQQGTYGVVGSDGTSMSWQRLLERIGFEQTYLYGSDRVDDLTWNRTEVAATFAFPMFGNIETPLFLTPGFAFNFIDGPSVGPADGDLPAQIYDAYLDLSWYPQPAPWLGAEVGVRTGVWTDFKNLNHDSVRLLGRGLVVVSTSPELDVLVGIVYLDRVRIKLLPAGGLRWRPSPDWDMYLVFPNPKIRRRFVTVSTAQWYWYLGGEYGGGSWTLERSTMDDRIDYNDIRVIWGLEWETQAKLRGHFEIGYVFDREIIYNSGTPGKFEPRNTFMLRGGVDF